MSGKTSALGQYLGYSIQVWRSLHYLIVSSPGSQIAVEVYDDVRALLHESVTHCFY